MSRVLITGAAGFVGSHLVDELLARDHEVVGLDDLSMGSLDNVSAHEGDPAFEMVVGDIRDAEALARAMTDVDAIVHLAALKIPKYGSAKETLLANTYCTELVLEAAVAHGARVLVASTSDVYGKNPEQPLGELSATVIGYSGVKRWAYAVSKLFDEHLCFAYAREHGLDFAVLRFFNSYGPRHHRSWWGGPQSVFIDAVLAGEPMVVHGTGEQRRCFTYASDLVDGIVAALESDAALGRVLNLGNPAEDVSINDLARLIAELAGVDPASAMTHVPHEELFESYEEVPARIPDIARARELLDYRPSVTLRDGLARTIEWHRANPPRGPIAPDAPDTRRDPRA